MDDLSQQRQRVMALYDSLGTPMQHLAGFTLHLLISESSQQLFSKLQPIWFKAIDDLADSLARGMVRQLDPPDDRQNLGNRKAQNSG